MSDFLLLNQLNHSENRNKASHLFFHIEVKLPMVQKLSVLDKERNTNLLLAECEVLTASYGPSSFLPFMAQARSARGIKSRKGKTRIHNLPYGPSKQG